MTHGKARSLFSISTIQHFPFSMFTLIDADVPMSNDAFHNITRLQCRTKVNSVRGIIGQQHECPWRFANYIYTRLGLLTVCLVRPKYFSFFSFFASLQTSQMVQSTRTLYSDVDADFYDEDFVTLSEVSQGLCYGLRSWHSISVILLPVHLHFLVNYLFS